MLRIAITAGLMMGASGAASAQATEERTPEEQAMLDAYYAARSASERELMAKQEAIEAELEALDRETLPEGHWAKEWAGEYYVGDGLGTNIRILVAPDSGVAYSWRGCLGLYDSNCGEILRVHPDGLELRLTTDPEEQDRPFMDKRLYFVRWGARRYLVPERQMTAFVNDYNEGGFAREALTQAPRKDSHFMNYGPAPTGLPELPERWAKKLLTEKVVLEITSVREIPVRPEAYVSGRWELELEIQGTQTLDVGLSFSLGNGIDSVQAQITEVNGRVCKADAYVWKSMMSFPAPEVGQVVVVPQEDE